MADKRETRMENGFFVMVTGQIEACQMPGVDNLYCKHQFVYGTDWKYMHGIEYGMSQIALSGTGSESIFTWNYPLDVTFRSTNPYGWPKLVLSVYGFNAFKRDVVRGYGFIHIPTLPGRHTRYVRLYTPQSSSLLQRFVSWITGNPPEFFDSKFVSQGKGREVTRVSSKGTVKMVFNVATKNMASFGYCIHDGSATTKDTQMQSKHTQEQHAA